MKAICRCILAALGNHAVRARRSAQGHLDTRTSYRHALTAVRAQLPFVQKLPDLERTAHRPRLAREPRAPPNRAAPVREGEQQRASPVVT